MSVGDERSRSRYPGDPSFCLKYALRGPEVSFPLDRREIVIGRSPENDLYLEDAGISRQHARITRDGDQWVVVDLTSRNGTWVNGCRVAQASLREGDEIVVGKVTLRFSRLLKEKLVIEEGAPIAPGPATIVRSVSDLGFLIPPGPGRPDAGPPSGRRAAAALGGPPVLETASPVEESRAPDHAVEAGAEVFSDELPALERSNRILAALARLSRNLLSVQSLDEVLSSVMDLVFEYIPAERGFLLLGEKGASSMEPMKVCLRDGAGPGGTEITVSRTLIDKVCREKVSILAPDAIRELPDSASIIAHGIRSAMCAPLVSGDRVIGVLHLDSRMRTDFGAFELDLLTALASYAAIAVEQARLGRRIEEEKKAKEKLERYHSPAVIRRILSASESTSGGVVLEVQEREVSVLFADIVGFTPLAENMEPRRVALMLNDFFSRMTEVIFDHEGTLDKYIGDEIMAVFGAPMIQRDHAARAVRAALAMHRAHEEASERIAPEARVSFRVAINSGKVVAGDIGSIKRMEYTVLGNTVNVASRLVKAVPDAGKVIIGEPTLKLIGDMFKVRDLGRVPLKGLTQEMPIYEVLQ
ncbi:MAG TPA: adenylate/guanylate cyclase domain-containing protein [Candidatus Polarisedimenticolia bacterium]|jgi:adenylate cyclase